jgi:hypothetical protein
VKPATPDDEVAGRIGWPWGAVLSGVEQREVG